MRWGRNLRLPARLAPGETLCSARGLTVELGGSRILTDVDLDVRAGELIVLVGPNGAGKSTLFNVLAGDLEPISGTVTIDGQPLEHWTPTELALRRAVLPQQVAVTFPFLVSEVVEMGRAPWNGTPLEDADDMAINEALAACDVSDLAHRHFPSLSGGERARVALARVLAQQTQLLFLDEPTAALDVHHQELVLEVVRRRVANGDGAVVVAHDLGLAAAYAQRVVVLSHGQVVANGPPATTLTPELLSEVYQHEIEVFPHPRTGRLVVLPVR